MTNLLTSYAFFIPWEIHQFFPVNKNTFSQQIATAWLQNRHRKHSKSTRHSRHSMLLTVGTCALVFHIRCAMIGRNNYNQSQLGKKKAPCFHLFRSKIPSLLFFFALDNFVWKVLKEEASLINWNIKNFCWKMLHNLHIIFRCIILQKIAHNLLKTKRHNYGCLLYTSPSPRDA